MLARGTSGMNIAVKIALALFVGTMLGFAATWFSVFGTALPGAVKDGPWRTSLAIGSSGGGLYTRAAVALHGLLALNRSETVYYTALTDSSGAPLDGACSYAVIGRDPDARWWSITAYGPDDYLIASAAHRYSVSKSSLAREPDGSFRATVSAQPSPGNWIALMPGRFSLTLRLYNPGAGVAADPAHAALPKIGKLSCE
jgi:hypothetical protein